MKKCDIPICIHANSQIVKITKLLLFPFGSLQHEIDIFQYPRQTHQLTIDEQLKFRFANNSRRQKWFKLQQGYHATSNSIKHIKFYQFILIVLKLKNPKFINFNQLHEKFSNIRNLTVTTTYILTNNSISPFYR